MFVVLNSANLSGSAFLSSDSIHAKLGIDRLHADVVSAPSRRMHTIVPSDKRALIRIALPGPNFHGATGEDCQE